MSKLTELLTKAKEEKHISATKLLQALQGLSEEQVDAVYAELDTAGVEIDTTPVYPQTKKTTLLCALAGMVVACALLVVSHLLHNYIVDDEDVQKKLDLPVLGFIPEV